MSGDVSVLLMKSYPARDFTIQKHPSFFYLIRCHSAKQFRFTDVTYNQTVQHKSQNKKVLLLFCWWVVFRWLFFLRRTYAHKCKTKFVFSIILRPQSLWHFLSWSPSKSVLHGRVYGDPDNTKDTYMLIPLWFPGYLSCFLCFCISPDDTVLRYVPSVSECLCGRVSQSVQA